MGIEVTQADRDAAADLARQVYGARIASHIADGTIEHHHFLDAFARHRQQAITQQAEEVARLREALEPFARSVYATHETPSGWRVGHVIPAGAARNAHLVFFGQPTALNEQPGREGTR